MKRRISGDMKRCNYRKGENRLIQIEGLCKQFPGTHAWALDGIHLQVEEGEVVGLLGENAAGQKPRILKIVAGLMEPTRGKGDD